MKVIGLMLTWNNLEFFKCALEMALYFSDEVIIVEGCHSNFFPRRSTDGTCEFIETLNNIQKIKVVDFEYSGRYDSVQKKIRTDAPRKSRFFKPGNWLFHFDDDVFYFKRDLDRLRTILDSTDCDQIGFPSRHFVFNFRFNKPQPYMGGISVHRILDGYRVAGISTPKYRSGKAFRKYVSKDIVNFHFSEVKKPERMKARWIMSVEKGTEASRPRFEKWMSVSWNKDEDIFKSEETLDQIKSGDGLNIYNGPYPEWLDNHPWRHINDIRKL